MFVFEISSKENEQCFHTPTLTPTPLYIHVVLASPLLFRDECGCIHVLESVGDGHQGKEMVCGESWGHLPMTPSSEYLHQTQKNKR